MINGESNRYWGLNRNLELPQYAGFLDANCERDSRDGPPCKYGDDPQAKTVLLIGDSHAGHFSQVVIDAARTKGWNSVIWTHGGCSFNLYDSSHDWCKLANYKTLNYVQNKRPDIVILSQSNTGNQHIYSSIRSIAQLELYAKKLVIIDETPRYTDTRYMNPGTLIQSPYVPPRSRSFRLESESYVQTAEKIYFDKQLSGAFILNLNHNFCNESRCFRWKDGNWLYRDLNHLSVKGAELALADFIKVLNSDR